MEKKIEDTQALLDAEDKELPALNMQNPKKQEPQKNNGGMGMGKF